MFVVHRQGPADAGRSSRELRVRHWVGWMNRWKVSLGEKKVQEYLQGKYLQS